MVCRYDRSWHNTNCIYPAHYSSLNTYNYPIRHHHNAHTNVDACIPLPTEVIGFPSSICASADGLISPDGEWEITVYIKVYDATTTLGKLTKTQTSLSVEVGAIFEGFGITESGLGGTVGVFFNLESYCLSACMNLYYGVDDSTAWSSLIDCYA